jgi:hypothetical protein
MQECPSFGQRLDVTKGLVTRWGVLGGDGCLVELPRPNVWVTGRLGSWGLPKVVGSSSTAGVVPQARVYLLASRVPSTTLVTGELVEDVVSEVTTNSQLQSDGHSDYSRPFGVGFVGLFFVSVGCFADFQSHPAVEADVGGPVECAGPGGFEWWGADE